MEAAGPRICTPWRARAVRLGLDPVNSGLAAWEAADLVLVTAPRWLDLDADAPQHVMHAGPLGIDVSVERPRLPERHRPRVLLTFSTTVMNEQPALIDRLCAAVTDLDLQPTLTLGSAVPPEAVAVPDEVEVLAFADHDRLMPECSAVICHGGLGTVLRALAHGVPLLVLPLGRDQPFNATRVEDLGAGIWLPVHAPPQRIRDAIGTLLTDASFRAAAVQASTRIASDQPDRTAADALERAAHRP
jgi:UDP:flavonoid glycosyltransferase YjiC (YdhE family)